MSPRYLTSPANVVETGSLRGFEDELLLQETPFFAAEGSVAYRRGGAATRAFLDNLPPAWQNAHLVVDSMLVWLQVGQCLKTRWFHHEVYPGRSERAFGEANGERDVEHVACAFGAPSEREFLMGDISEIEGSDMPFDLYGAEPKDYPARHLFLRERLAAGHLETVRIGVRAIHRYGWGTFQRAIETETAGYHFWIRASYGSRRPIVNGIRNVASPSHTGPWLAGVTL